ncbi:DUF4112 domain-containing protein [Sulfitobacter sp. W074]|uniref:DUF4112 domain-containing protein n=1 Tax=Sulfitobacter sp. W074 TaxID=2867026 RepID=UPI0021A40C4B|nr:DUF4112 domain-containing protein [Sulfitobacter sp. W074]UWR35996.1 DUF4112 domain-containing protein [Sulfitobacter sp. W074]
MEPHAPSHEADLARLRRLAVSMDSAFKVPIVGVRMGWDSILGFVPVVGDTLALLPSAYILKESHRMGAPKGMLAKMLVNTGIDYVIGSVPLVGDLFDIGWKSKLRNVDLLERHLKDQAAKAPPTENVEGRMSSHHPTLNN